MEKVLIKNTDIKVSRLCFGGCPMGEYGWGDVSRNDLLSAVNEAIDFGINFFDTADVYGCGTSERNLGEALGKNRSRVIIATKFGVRIEQGKTIYDNSPEWINEAVESSLKRLKTDYIDIYQLHYWDQITPISCIVETLEQLKKRGLIRYYGLSNINYDDFCKFGSYAKNFICFQSEYSLACRKNEDDMFKISNYLTPLTWGSLGQGILTGKYDINSRFDSNDRRSRDVYVNFHGEKLIHNLKIVEELKRISNIINKPVSSIAIRWILDFLPDSIVIAGIKKANQLLTNISALGWHLHQEHMDQLNTVSKAGGQ